MSNKKQLEQAITALEGQRAILGDAVVDASLTALRKQLAELKPTHPSQQQRKQATILFADVSGFTAMSETMDAEEVNEVMNALWQRLDAVIAKRNGYIDKHIGDALMALWGADVAHENDAEQAVHAALALQAELNAFATETGNPLKMRIGLNTGLVLLGEVGTTHEFTAIGDAVNIASRLEQAAPVGGILISYDTYRHVRGVFDVEPLEPITVKGKSEPLQVYRVQQAKARAFRMGRRGVEGIATKMVGREKELAQLQTVYETVFSDRKLRFVTIVGEAGLGKSRLLDEFDHWLELRPETIRFYKGRARLETRHLPHALLRDVIVFRFQIQESDDLATVWQKMETGLGEFNQHEAEDIIMRAHILGQWLGFDFSTSPHAMPDGEELRNRAQMYLADYFKEIEERETAVLFLEDIHWADESSLSALTDFVRRMMNYPLLVVALARPTLLERQPQWGREMHFYSQIELHPLSVAESDLLVSEVLQKVKAVPKLLQELIVNNAEGNPFYVEELIKMLVEDGVIVKAEPYWQVAETKLVKVKVPATLTAVLQARLDRLHPDERETLQRAAVIGRIFWDDLVVQLSEGQVGAETEYHLTGLTKREMIFRRQHSTFVDSAEHIFKHAILQQVTYETVLLRLRRRYHALVADWLIAHSSQRSGEITGLIGDHLLQANQPERALPYLRRAGEEAAARYAHEEASRYLSLALELLPAEDTRTRYELLLAREASYHIRGERTAQAADLATLATLAAELDANQQLQVALRQSQYALFTDDYPTAIETSQIALAQARGSGNETAKAEAYHIWGNALRQQAKYEEAKTKLLAGVELAQASGVARIASDCLRILGNIAERQGTLTEALMYQEQALTIARQIGDRLREGWSLHGLASTNWYLGNYEKDRTYCEAALNIYRQIGARTEESNILADMGDASKHHSEYKKAQAQLEQGLAIAQEIGDKLGQSFRLYVLGGLFADLGNYHKAQNCFAHGLVIAQAIGYKLVESHIVQAQGSVAFRLGDREIAKQLGQQALVLSREIGYRLNEGYSLHSLGDVYLVEAEIDLAAAYYEQELALWQTHNIVQDILGAWAGLADVALAKKELDTAQTHVATILARLADNTGGIVHEPRVYLTCVRVLQAVGDERVPAFLEQFYNALQERAAQLDEDERRMYLENVAEHRQLIVLWQAAQGSQS